MNLIFFKIAREGLQLIFTILIIGWILALLGYLHISLLFLLLTLFLVYFFRDPERIVLQESNAIISPADGKIIEISEETEEEYLNEDTKKISIFLSIFDCHINRFPVSGKVLGTKYYPGKFIMAFKKKASKVNERLLTHIESNTGIQLVMVQIAGLLARRIISYANLESEFNQGEKFGMIKFGSRVDLYLPVSSQIDIELGQKVKAGETVLAWTN
ncbi:MAG: phosphatidylserine decarboxylase family protein [Candidatus Dadabacteria bacterium]|nr:phosphatidylserine decarboxylase family protein [Candidatus Dadabacteria bacterium]NIQ14239.1 phosphatidylserine decarboxylase family protein [Candidatus Dadabacteria bacterium]